MKRVTVHNPGKARARNPVETLAIINKGGKSMTRSKTRSTTANKRRTTKANTKGRRNRRRNPSLKGIATGAFWAFGGAAATNVIGAFIPLQLAGWPAIAMRFGIAYVAGWIAEKVTTPQNAQLVAIGGASSAAGDAVNLLMGAVHPLTQQTGNLQLPGMGPAAPATANGGAGDIVKFPYRGVGDIVKTPDYAQTRFGRAA